MYNTRNKLDGRISPRMPEISHSHPRWAFYICRTLSQSWRRNIFRRRVYLGVSEQVCLLAVCNISGICYTLGGTIYRRLRFPRYLRFLIHKLRSSCWIPPYSQRCSMSPHIRFDILHKVRSCLSCQQKTREAVIADACKRSFSLLGSM